MVGRIIGYVTCDVENVQRRPMGGIDGCILLLNELLVLRTVQLYSRTCVLYARYCIVVNHTLY